MLPDPELTQSRSWTQSSGAQCLGPLFLIQISEGSHGISNAEHLNQEVQRKLKA